MGHLIIVDLRRHAARTVLTGLGIAIGVATIVALLALSAGIERSASGLIGSAAPSSGCFRAARDELDSAASSLPQSLVRAVKPSPAWPTRRRSRSHRELPTKPSFLVFGVEADSFVFRSLVFVAAGRPSRRRGVSGSRGAPLGLDVDESLRLRSGQLPRRRASTTPAKPFEDQGAALHCAVVERMRGRPG